MIFGCLVRVRIIGCFLIFFVCCGLQAHGKTGAYFYLKNNCPYDVYYQVGNEVLISGDRTRLLTPQQRKKVGYFKDTKTSFIFFKDDEAKSSIRIRLHSNLLHHMMDADRIYGAIDIDRRKMKWHGWYGTPSFTITACPETIDVKNSPFFWGVERILIFGDSLSDGGELHKLTMGLVPKSTPYYSGCFSDGPPWSMLLKQELRGVIPVSDYAVGGSTARIWLGKVPYSLHGQYDVYVLNHLRTSPEKELAFILVGANDYLTVKKNASDEYVEHVIHKVINNIYAMINRLHKKGVKKFVLINLPNMGETPFARHDMKNSDIEYTITRMHNKKLKELVDHYNWLYSLHSSHFYYVDLFSIMENIVHHTEQINREMRTDIKNVSDSCWKGGFSFLENSYMFSKSLLFTSKLQRVMSSLPKSMDLIAAIKVATSMHACRSPEEYLFWDKMHPTAQTHEIFYQKIKSRLGIKMIPVINH